MVGLENNWKCSGFAVRYIHFPMLDALGLGENAHVQSAKSTQEQVSHHTEIIIVPVSTYIQSYLLEGKRRHWRAKEFQQM